MSVRLRVRDCVGVWVRIRGRVRVRLRVRVGFRVRVGLGLVLGDRDSLEDTLGCNSGLG